MSTRENTCLIARGSLRGEPTSFSTDKIPFPLYLLSGHFYGQSRIKPVWDPLVF